MKKKITFGENLTDKIASFGGSWTALIIQTIFITIWILLNVFKIVTWDIYPFILLNLFFSLQAAYAAPIIMMSSNRQAQLDRQRDELDFKLDRDTNQRIKELEKKIDRITDLLGV